MISAEEIAELERLSEIVNGRDRGEYAITGEIVHALGCWLMDNRHDLLAMLRREYDRLPVSPIPADYADSAE